MGRYLGKPGKYGTPWQNTLQLILLIFFFSLLRILGAGLYSFHMICVNIQVSVGTVHSLLSIVSILASQ